MSLDARLCRGCSISVMLIDPVEKTGMRGAVRHAHQQRQPCRQAKQVQTSPMTTPDQGPSAGEKTALLGFQTLTVFKILPLPSGTRKSMGILIIASRAVLLTRCSDFLKERLFGLSNPQGNHGESIKEAHFHLDNTPTVSTSSQRQIEIG